MKNCIINPKWIYMMDVLGGVDIVMTILAVLLSIATVGYLLWVILWYFEEIHGYNLDECSQYIKTLNLHKSILRKIIIIPIICILLATAIPSQKTMYTMFVASFTTQENIEAGGELVTDTVDYIFDKVDQLLEDKE